MSALDDVVLAVREGITQGNYEGWKKVEDAQFELAQLREEIRVDALTIEQQGGTIHQLRADLQAAQERIAEQARQLAEAREVIKRCSAYIGSIDHGENTKSYMMCDAWLAANPAPQEPQP